MVARRPRQGYTQASEIGGHASTEILLGDILDNLMQGSPQPILWTAPSSTPAWMGGRVGVVVSQPTTFDDRHLFVTRLVFLVRKDIIMGVMTIREFSGGRRDGCLLDGWKELLKLVF